MMDDTPQDSQSGMNKPQKYDFESMHLQVGSRIQLILFRGTKPVNHFTTLIGYVKEEYLLVKIPFEQGAPVTLRDGERLNVRAFSGTTVCSFSATVERIFLSPFFYVHLSFPGHIEGSTLRKALRVKVNLPAQLNAIEAKEGKSVDVEVVINNLSVAGALVESEHELKKSDSSQAPVHISFTLITQPNDLEVHVKAKAGIMNVNLQKGSSPEQPDKYTYGLQFIDLEPTHLIMLQNLTYEALIGDRSKLA